jgi:hypothetical protein
MPRGAVRFEILLNGLPVATIGVGDFGVLTTLVTRVRRSPATISEVTRSRHGFDETTYLQESCELSMSSLASGTNEHGSWKPQSLAEGDVVTIRILPAGDYDLPDVTDAP